MTSTRYRQLEYQLQFLTPAFLGNAKQSAQWRTPPIKALLRQWWRVTVAEEMNFDVTAIRKREGELFGTAADGGNSRKSQVRIRLDSWNEGGLKNWEPLGKVKHPEVNHPVGADLYLGYGPLKYQQQKTTLSANAAIQAGESGVISIAFPESFSHELLAAITLMNQYGALGGRSRNGWGSFTLTPKNDETPALSASLDQKVERDWRTALKLDWPHAIGLDDSLLVWQTTKPESSWRDVMLELAKIKISLRTQFRFTTGHNAPVIEQRHWLSYPITNHSVKAWGRNMRLPNSLRFKACKQGSKLYGVIYHMPCQPPRAFKPDQLVLEDVWGRVHQHLDNTPSLKRLAD